MNKIFIFVVYLSCITYSLDCTLDNNHLKLNETTGTMKQFIISNRGSQNVSIYVPSASFYVPDNNQYRANQKSSVTIKIRLSNTDTVYDGETIPIYCYDLHNPDDNQLLNIKVVNEINNCNSDSFEIVEGECNEDSYMTVSYRYKENVTCLKVPLPENESVSCYNKDLQKNSAIALYVFFGIITLMWFYTVYNVVKLYWIYLQYLPPHFIVVYALGTVFISAFEASRSFVDNETECLVVLIIGAFGHTIHSSAACATATYMYYEKIKMLKIKNNWLYLSLHLATALVLEFIIFAIGYHYYYGFGRNIELLSGLTYTMPLCDSHPICIIYFLPAITWFITIHFYTLYNVQSQSENVYVFQIWRIGLACIMLTYYLMEIFLSEYLYLGKQRLLFAFTVNLAHIASHGIFYPLGLEVKDENLRPKLEAHIMTDNIYRECFRLYLSQDNTDHYLSFWEDCQTFKKFSMGSNKRIIIMLNKIINRYISNTANKRIRFPTTIKEEILSYASNPKDKDVFTILDKSIYFVYSKLEKQFPDFLKSKQSYYVDIPYKWLHDFTYFHPALQYAVRIRMCENAVTDKETGFSYQMSKGRIVNPNSCFQLSDIPELLGQLIKKDVVKVTNSGINPVDVLHEHINNNNNNNNGTENEVEIPRDNVYIPPTCMNNEMDGTTACGFATLGDAATTRRYSSDKKERSEYGSLKVVNCPSPTAGVEDSASPF